MFKKFKDKLAEEVKSSPQRLQQFAQAAQAAVTSASSSISDITNNDLFSIGDSDSASKSQSSSNSQQSTFRDVSPVYQASIQSGSDVGDSAMVQEESQRQRRLSNSSFASDVSFRLPSYESPSMYHLQSDVEVSASEAEEKGFNGSMVNLDRVTKEQLYAAYRHTQDRCKKYKTQYADLARHYKLLERENAKARNVLVETQDKALRRISELREQCTLEQSAKAHLEKALRIDIEERNMKIHALNTKLNLLQNNHDEANNKNECKNSNTEKESDTQLINLIDNGQKVTSEDTSSEICTLNSKLEKMEQLLNKYKESLKVAKEKNAQMTTEVQILSNELTTKTKEIEELKTVTEGLNDSKKRNQELNEIIEELQNKCNSYEFSKSKETSILEINLNSAHEEILLLKSKIDELKKREEEYAISLAENKLSIHKELESKEAEIKSLKDSLSAAQNETQSLHIVINDYKNNITKLESECVILKSGINDCNVAKANLKETEMRLEELAQKCQMIESSKSKLDEKFKCLQLQMKQETAEKLAIIDRNTYLESRNSQLIEENNRKSSQICNLESKLESHMSKDDGTKEIDTSIQNEIILWKTKYENLEKEIQDEREELIKLQSEIEKLLHNYESLQNKNIDLNNSNSNLKRENKVLQEQVLNIRNVKQKYVEINKNIKEVRQAFDTIANDTRTAINFINDEVFHTICNKMMLINELFTLETNTKKERYDELKMNYDVLEQKMFNLLSEQNKTLKELQILQEESDISKIKIDQYESEILQLNQMMKSTDSERKEALNKISLLKGEIENLKNKIENDVTGRENAEEKLQVLQRENRRLQDQLEENKSLTKESNEFLKQEKKLCQEKILNVSKQYESSLDEINLLKEELQKLRKKLDNNEVQCLKQSEIVKKMELDSSSLLEKLKDKDNAILLLTTNLEKEKELCKEKIEENNIVSNNYKSVLSDNEEKNELIQKLQDDILSLTQENLSLKNLAENISLNVSKLEQEINEVRTSHTEIEKQKNHLNTVIDQLEKTQAKRILDTNNDKDSQTDITGYEIEETSKEYKHIMLSHASTTPLHSESDTMQGLNEIPTELVRKFDEQGYASDVAEKYNNVQSEYELIKEENRRLQSEVEGLQIYLTKISKENSALNDKIRDYIISGDNLPDKTQSKHNNIEELKSEIQHGKEKIENLIRENTILVEENLELKDQIHLHSYDTNNESKTTSIDNNTELELQSMKNKYKNLLDAKTNLEKKLVEIEEMNQSVTNNFQHMQVNNEKLRLSNEKLERRLDEALVSLRHLHALQENTELEYLRNILYEYLTGSGTHSLTLAKVLSAVVKFNDSQTDLVLQKEKERQGFLRQLGLL